MSGPAQHPRGEMHFLAGVEQAAGSPTVPFQPLLSTTQPQTSTVAVLGHPGRSFGKWPCPYTPQYGGASHGQWPLFSHQDSYSTKENSLHWSTRDAGRTGCVWVPRPKPTGECSRHSVLCPSEDRVSLSPLQPPQCRS